MFVNLSRLVGWFVFWRGGEVGRKRGWAVALWTDGLSLPASWIYTTRTIQAPMTGIQHNIDIYSRSTRGHSFKTSAYLTISYSVVLYPVDI